VAAGALMVREAGGRFEPLGIAGLEDEADRSPVNSLSIGGYVAGAPGVWDAFRALIPG